MRISIIYVYPLGGANGFLERAIKFLETYHACPPGIDHETAIVCNGSSADGETRYQFASLPNVRFLERGNEGRDIAAFQVAAQQVPCDMMVFFGSNTYFKRPGWLKRMADLYAGNGDNLYGCTGNQGDARFNVYPHVRTTAFWCSPHLMNACPCRVTHDGLRYEFEHGPTGLTTWVLRQNKRAFIASWEGLYPLSVCDGIPNGFHNGDQSNVMVGDRLTAPPYYHCE